MGLDAAVYKKLERLPFTQEQLRFVSVDARTGQIDFENADLFKAWRDKVKVVEKRIGNIALVDILKSEIKSLLGQRGATTLMLNKVLYSGTHAGDVILSNDMGELKKESALIREMAGTRLPQDLRIFLDDMGELIAASESEGNPIVFI